MLGTSLGIVSRDLGIGNGDTAASSRPVPARNCAYVVPNRPDAEDAADALERTGHRFLALPLFLYVPPFRTRGPLRLHPLHRRGLVGLLGK